MSTGTGATWFYFVFTSVCPQKLEYKEISIGMLQKGLLIVCLMGMLQGL
jgi:hypothetical protein